jgi:hypothetical protein
METHSRSDRELAASASRKDGNVMTDQSADLCGAIGAVMGQVLARGPLTPGEDFFDCGGDSLRAIEVLQRLLSERGPIDEYLPQTPGKDELEAALLEAIFEDASPAALEEVLRCSPS